MKRHQLQHVTEQKTARKAVAQETQSVQEFVEAPLPGSLESIQAMQSLHGNRTTASMMTGATGALSQPVQAKLTVTEAGDQHEQEADRVAEQVVSRMYQPVQRAPEEEEMQMKRDDSVQRAPEEEEMQMKRDDSVQRAPEEEEEMQMKRDDSVQRQFSTLQRKESGDLIGGTTLTPELEQSIARARAGGSALESGVRGHMEQQMGADFSGVRVHTGTETDQLANSLQAKAFTTGQDVFFRSDQYRPSDRGGQQLIAHELTHVIQQNPAVQKKREGEE